MPVSQQMVPSFRKLILPPKIKTVSIPPFFRRDFNVRWHGRQTTIGELREVKMEIRKQDNGRVLVIGEREGQEITPITLEVLQAGRELADQIGGKLCSVVIGNNNNDLSEEISQYSDEVYSLNHPLLESFDPEFHTSALNQLCQLVNPTAILMGHTLNNQNVAPKLAYKMGMEVITDCIQLAIEAGTGHILCSKPVYGAKYIATFKLEKKPYVVTLRSKAWEPIISRATKGEVIQIALVLEEASVKVECTKKIREESINLNKADAIVSAGRGVKNAEGGLSGLTGLVEVLGSYFSRVELGASRPLVDAHLVPSSRQVGLTGEKVAPALYIAIGISGSLQHVTGILRAKKIVAINTDPKANIFTVADYGVIGDFEEVVPALIRKLEELQ
jgi:electron transfer flavoprotein alpha subunit